MSKYNLYVNDCMRAILSIEKSTGKINWSKFKEDKDIIDANAMRVQVIGESIKKIPKEYKTGNLKVIQTFENVRNIISHAYFRINSELLYKLIKEDIPILKKEIKKIKKELK